MTEKLGTISYDENNSRDSPELSPRTELVQACGGDGNFISSGHDADVIKLGQMARGCTVLPPAEIPITGARRKVEALHPARDKHAHMHLAVGDQPSRQAVHQKVQRSQFAQAARQGWDASQVCIKEGRHEAEIQSGRTIRKRGPCEDDDGRGYRTAVRPESEVVNISYVWEAVGEDEEREQAGQSSCDKRYIIGFGAAQNEQTFDTMW
ncbi:hypothetical protein EDB86DRAFT_3194535 [Lactarius hatsudake]|nr:hypothetical protein EDB86DRAFT_3194535 [Lactarius hatsudake]